MTKLRKLLTLLLAILMLLTVCACGEAVDMETTTDDSKTSQVNSSAKEAKEAESEDGPPIMSSDRVMSKYFDISVFDEENYADIYLGKKFDIDCTYAEDVFEVPTTIDKMKELGWDFCKGNAYDENSLVFSYETIETTLQNERGTTVKAW